jgi:putative transposase
MRYIELNPVRAGMVDHPREYRWSSYHANAYGKLAALVTPHKLYEALSTDEAERKKYYRAMFSGHIDDEVVKEIRATSQTGTPLGNNRFIDQIEAVLGRKVGLSDRGRPRKGL